MLLFRKVYINLAISDLTLLDPAKIVKMEHKDMKGNHCIASLLRSQTPKDLRTMDPDILFLSFFSSFITQENNYHRMFL